MDRPVYLALPPGPSLDSARSAVPDARVLPPPAEGPDLAPLDPGLLLIDAATSLEALVALTADLPADGGGWMLAVLQPDSAGGAFRTVSLGRTHPLADAANGADPARGSRATTVVDLNLALRDIAKSRHDLNNPLTSAMAETQLALLDAPEGELREALEIIQAQLRRLRDLVAATSHLRPFRD